MELITAVNSNLHNKNNILYCPHGLLLTDLILFNRPFNKCEKDDTFKIGRPIIPLQNKSTYEWAYFRPAVNSISDNDNNIEKAIPY